MHARIRIAFGAVLAATAMTVGLIGPAQADPPNGGPAITTKNDITGVGSDTTQEVMGAYSAGYNAAATPAKPPYARSWDATGSATIDVDGTGTVCSSTLTRPNGSSAGISALVADTSAGAQTGANNQCLDYARSSRARRSTDPATLKFIGYGRDVVTWAYFPTTAGQPATPIPANLSLTTAQLRGIYQCTITNWSAVGGAAGTIVPVLPQTGSGTRDFWLQSLGGGTAITPGACVKSGAQENNGAAVRTFLTNNAEEPRAIFPYSVANWVSQRDPGGIPVDDRSGANLNRVNATNPLTNSNNQTTGVLNPSANYSRIIYNVVKADSAGQVPAYLRAFLITYVCANDTEGAGVLTQYGFGSLSTGCGVVS